MPERVSPHRFTARVEYDGTDFAGFQVNPGRRTVQGVLEDALAHLVGMLHVQGDPGNRTERAKPDHEAVEVGIAPFGLDDLTARRHELEAGDRGREVAVRSSRAVRRRRHGARNGDVGKRREVVQPDALRAL